MSKRELVFAALDNKKTDRVPVGFWFHFAPESVFDDSPATIQKNIEGHQRFFDEFQPDFLKLMSDGYFGYPNETVSAIKSAEDLNQVTASNPEAWIEGQVKLVKELTRRFGESVAAFYNIFSPTTYFRFLLEESGSGLTLERLIKENPEGLKQALSQVGKDIGELARRVIKDGGADGIYLSVQNIQGKNISREEYKAYIAPGELHVLDTANQESEYNLLHICGYEGARNDLLTYTDYPSKAVNWAVTVENVSLKEGKELFGGRAVIGGFKNTKEGILYRGTKKEIEEYTDRLLSEAGTQGVILGADCTIPTDTPIEHLSWVRERAKAAVAE